MEISLKQKRVLVTGAASGIGRGVVEKLVKCGAKTIALDYNEALLKKLKEDFPNIDTAIVDLSNWNSVKEKITQLFPIDCLVNNAGVAFIAPLINITEDEFDKTFDINVKAVLNVTKIVSGDLIKRNAAGSIVNISSQASQAGLLNHSIYCASKGAIDAFTRVAALELGSHNIRINAVNPTVVMTELGRKIWSDPKMGQPMLAKIPLNRFAEIEDVVNAVLFLLSDKAAMITGTCLPIDGGFLAG